jgi:hypothetical protein
MRDQYSRRPGYILRTAIPNRRPGDTIPLGAARSLRVVDVRDDDAHEPPVLAATAASVPGSWRETSGDRRRNLRLRL